MAAPRSLLLLLSMAMALAACAAESPRIGCPACGGDLQGFKISTVHPGEPAVVLAGVGSAAECREQCLGMSSDVLFFQHTRATSGETSCHCLASCYSISEADASKEEARSGSLCRDQGCPSSCSNAPAPNVMYLGTPANTIWQPFTWAVLGGNGSEWSVNGTQLVQLNGTLLTNSSSIFASNGTNSTSGNSTFAGAVGMSFEDCRALAASNVAPLTPYFTHLEAMGTCLLFEKCVGIAPAGTSTAKSGSFCVPTLLRGPLQRELPRKLI